MNGERCDFSSWYDDMMKTLYAQQMAVLDDDLKPVIPADFEAARSPHSLKSRMAERVQLQILRNLQKATRA